MHRHYRIVTALVGCLLTFSARAQIATWSDELLFNPGAETGDLSGWSIVATGSGAIPNVDAGTYDVGLTPRSGSWDFVGDTYPAGGGAVAQLRQLVDVSTVPGFDLTDIDASLVSARLSFWEQSYFQGGFADYARVTLTFHDGSGGTLAAVSSADLASTNSGSGTGNSWTQFTQDYFLPAGTRSIGYTMEFVRGANGGTYIDAFIDDNSLQLFSGSAVPEPTSSTAVAGGAILAAVLLRRRRHRPLTP